MTPQAKRTRLEQHAQSVGVALLIAFCIWAAGRLHKVDIVAQSMEDMSRRIGSLESVVLAGTRDRYHAEDARRDFAVRDKSIDRLQSRLDFLEAEYNRQGNDKE